MRDYSLNRHACFQWSGRFSLAVELRREAGIHWVGWKRSHSGHPGLGGAGRDILGEVGEQSADQDQQPHDPDNQ